MELLTRKDLEEFKEELFTEIKKLIAENQYGLPKFLQSSEVRKLFHISETKLYELRRDSKIPFLKVDGKYLYSYTEILNAFKTF